MAVANGDGSQQPDKNNPFSFKNYIKKKSDDSPLIKKHPKGKTKKKIEEEVPFPDFIQEMDSKKDTNKKEENPFSYEKFITQKNHSKHDNSLSSDDSSSSLPSMPKPLPLIEGLEGKQSVDPAPKSYDDFSTSSESSFEEDEENSSTELPLPPGSKTPSDTAKDELVEQLLAENERMKRKLTETENKLHKEVKRTKDLERKVKALKIKEQQEAKVLEAMVQKAEKNLTATTERAILAETQVSQLKKEILSLQEQLGSPRCEGYDHHYESVLIAIREKAMYASKHMNKAAVNADRSIRDLVNGIETLKHLAEVFASIDKLAEVKEKEGH